MSRSRKWVAVALSMLGKVSTAIVFLGLSVTSALAAVPLYGQCGGTGYTGDTTCVSGSVCVKLNDYYSQCQAGTATQTTPTSTVPAPTSTPVPTTTAPTATPTSTGPIIVLPLGDSITFGLGSNDGNAYRKELKDRLAQDGINIDYIGTVKNGNIPDNDNEGHSGATIDQIRGYAATPLRQKPEVVTLMAGTNDMISAANGAPQRLMTLIDTIYTASPDATVIVGSLIPLSFAQASVDTYNREIQRLVEARAASGQKIIFVSMSSITNSDLADGVHPNAGGYVKMGTAYYNGWTSGVQKGFIRAR